jgi:hypothetical protein
MRLRVGAVRGVTDPFETGGWTYYASVVSWARQVDAVFIVDGHSTEDLLLRPTQTFGSNANVEALKPPETFWGKGDLWHLAQSSHNLNFALKKYGDLFDIIFVVGADQVVYPAIRKVVEDVGELLSRQGDWCCFYRTRVRQNGLVRWCDTRGVMILPGKSNGFTNPLHGWDPRNGAGVDVPIDISHKASFSDPVTDVSKTFYGGTVKPALGVVECGSHGQFWDTRDQCLLKMRRWNRAVTHYEGVVPERSLELQLLNDLGGYYS